MLKYIIQPDKTYKGQLYKSRKIIADELYLERLLKVPEAIVYSSWRSLEEQKKLLAEGKSQTLYSNHRRGMACDLVNWSECETKMRAVGLINDISWDRNHFAYDGETKASKYPIYDTANNLTEYTMNKDFLDQIEKICGKDYGDNLNDREQADVAERLKKYREEKVKLREENETIQREITDALNENTALKVKIENQSYMLRANEKTIAELKSKTEGVEGLTITQLFKEIINKILKS